MANFGSIDHPPVRMSAGRSLPVVIRPVPQFVFHMIRDYGGAVNAPCPGQGFQAIVPATPGSRFAVLAGGDPDTGVERLSEKRGNKGMRARRNHGRRVHRGRVFELHVDNVTLENGVTVDMDVLRHPGAAAVVPLTDQGGVLLLRQFRYAIGTDIWEIPAGTLNPGEAPLACARRELAEEAGVMAVDWSALGAITPLPGYSDEIIHLFSARRLSPVPQNLDADELLEVREIPLQTALSMITTQAIRDAKTITGLLLAAGIPALHAADQSVRNSI
jgi:ADP-ribose pyrophosphatase